MLPGCVAADGKLFSLTVIYDIGRIGCILEEDLFSVKKDGNVRGMLEPEIEVFVKAHRDIIPIE